MSGKHTSEGAKQKMETPRKKEAQIWQSEATVTQVCKKETSSDRPRESRSLVPPTLRRGTLMPLLQLLLAVWISTSIVCTIQGSISTGPPPVPFRHFQQLACSSSHFIYHVSRDSHSYRSCRPSDLSTNMHDACTSLHVHRSDAEKCHQLFRQPHTNRVQYMHELLVGFDVLRSCVHTNVVI